MGEHNKATARRLITEGDQVVGRFTCSATHLRGWLGHPLTGRRFERVDEVSIFRLRDGRSTQVWSWRTPSGVSGGSAWPEPNREPSQAPAAPDRRRLPSTSAPPTASSPAAAPADRPAPAPV